MFPLRVMEHAGKWPSITSLPVRCFSFPISQRALRHYFRMQSPKKETEMNVFFYQFQPELLRYSWKTFCTSLLCVNIFSPTRLFPVCSFQKIKIRHNWTKTSVYTAKPGTNWPLCYRLYLVLIIWAKWAHSFSHQHLDIWSWVPVYIC